MDSSPIHLQIRKAVRYHDSATLLSLLVSPSSASVPTSGEATTDFRETVPIVPWMAYEACRQGAVDVLDGLLRLRARNSFEVLSARRWNTNDRIDPSRGCDDRDDDDATTGGTGTTLLAVAAVLHDPTCTELLLTHGANPWQSTESGDLPLWRAGRHGRLRTVQRLVTAMTTTTTTTTTVIDDNHSASTMSPVVTDGDRWVTRAVQMACHFGHLAVVQYLLSRNVGTVSLSSITARDDRGWSIWFDAAWAGQGHVIEWLWVRQQQQETMTLDTDNDPYDFLWLRDDRGGIWMHRATAGCHVSRIVPLWEFVAQQLSPSLLAKLILATDDDGDSSLSAAAWDDRIEVLDWLLVRLRHPSTAEQHLEIRNAIQHAIFHACDNDQVQALPPLLKHYRGTMEDQRCATDGRTCLDKAILWGHDGIVHLLTGSRYRYRVTAVHAKAARQLGRLECLHILLQANPDLIKVTYASGGESNNILLVTIPMCQPGKQSHWEYTWYLINMIVKMKLHEYFEQTNIQGRTAREMAIFTKSYATAAVLSDPLVTCFTGKDVDELLLAEDTTLTKGALCRPRLKPPKGWTCLHTACCLGRIEIVDYLLRLPDVNATAATTQGMTPLHWASRHGHVDICHRLLTFYQEDAEIRKSIHIGPASQQSPLWGPSRHGHARIVRMMMRANLFDVNAVDEDDNSALYMATAAGHEDVVTILSNDASIDVNSINADGETCLHRACLDQRCGIVETLLRAGADPNIADAITGETALHYAGACGFGETGCRILSALLDRGSDVHRARARDHWTPLHCAVWAHREELFWQESPSSASLRGVFPTINILVHWGAQLDALDTEGKTPMDLANHHPTLQLYLESLSREQTPSGPIY